MNFSLKWLCMTCMGVIFITGSYAQKITNISPKLEGKEIVITYDLEAENPDALCEVFFYFGDKIAQTNLLKEAKGDFGSDISIGKEKQIRVSNIQPFLPYMKDLTFKAVAKYSFVPIANLNTLTGTKVKMKSTIPLTWEGGSENVTVSLIRFQDGRLINSAPIVIKNSQKYDFVLLKTAKKGSGYKIILKDDVTGKELNTGVFSVKPKIPGAVIVLLSAVVLGGVVFVLLNKKGTSPDNPDNIETLGLPALAEGAHPGG